MKNFSESGNEPYVSPYIAHPLGYAIIDYLDRLKQCQIPINRFFRSFPRANAHNLETRMEALRDFAVNPEAVFKKREGFPFLPFALEVAHQIGFDIRSYRGLRKTEGGWIDRQSPTPLVIMERPVLERQKLASLFDSMIVVSPDSAASTSAYASPLSSHPFGRALINYMKDKGLSPDQFLSRLESGRRGFTVQDLKTLASDPTRARPSNGIFDRLAFRAAHLIEFNLAAVYGELRVKKGVWVDRNSPSPCAPIEPSAEVREELAAAFEALAAPSVCAPAAAPGAVAVSKAATPVKPKKRKSAWAITRLLSLLALCGHAMLFLCQA